MSEEKQSIKLHCPMCGSTRMDPEARNVWTPGGAARELVYGKGRFLPILDKSVPVSGVACLTCGFVSLFVDPANLCNRFDIQDPVADRTRPGADEFGDTGEKDPDIPDAGDDARPLG